ncbi:MAG: hypothetical protein E4H14_03640 [Candidatus Thorarchaeota archaeon]|nr:MAG: hypothetical protein E4H14_03640 [Candidatus Thorarchaeota archaeon]
MTSTRPTIGPRTRTRSKYPDDVTPRFTCQWCHHVFVREDRYLAHECKQMKRMAELKTPTGQAAWQFYQTWMKKQGRMPPPASSFLSSKYYRTFINFTKFAKNTNLPTPEKFIWLMLQKDYPPVLWCNDEVYTMYLEFLDYKTTPIEQVKLSIETLLIYADKHEVDIKESFEKLLPTEVIHMVRTRQLSPWLLLFCPSFKKMFKERVSPEQKIILEMLIRADHWSKQFETHADTIEKIKHYVQELRL